jgi:FMN phosphatase YigB (HAD superfamily)
MRSSDAAHGGGPAAGRRLNSSWTHIRVRAADVAARTFSAPAFSFIPPGKQTATPLSKLAAVDLEDFDLVSVDVFDTILLRDLSLQTQRFAEISRLVSEANGQCAQPSALLALRLSLHGLAYRAVAIERPHGDAKLMDLLRLQARLLGSEDLAERLHETELSLERDRLTANEPLLALLERFAASGKRIVATSDTYYSARDIEQLLGWIAGAHPIARVYASSDLGLTKHAGGIFAEVARREGVNTARILHCGDDLHADVEMARSAGCHPVHLPRSRAFRLARKASAALFFATRLLTTGSRGV